MKIPSMSSLATGALALTSSSRAEVHATLPVATSDARATDSHLLVTDTADANKNHPNLRGSGNHTNRIRSQWNKTATQRQLKSSNNDCRARVEESANNKAVYTVVDAETNFCTRWVGEMTTGCAGVQTLLPSENFVSSLTIPNDVLAYSINPVLRGWVTSDGNTTQATADCAAATFHKVIKEYKGDPLYKVELGVGIGVGSALVIGLGAYLAAKHLPRHRASAVGAPAA